MNTTLLRAISGSVYVALVVVLLSINSFTVVTLFMLLLVIGNLELSKILVPLGDSYKAVSFIVSILIVSLFGVSFVWPEFPLIIFLPFLPALLFGLLVIMLFKEPMQGSLSKIGNTFISISYLSFPLSMAIVIAQMENAFTVLAIFIFLWVNDTFAYIFGRWLGKHKLAERISPKKTWEGFVGGMIMSGLAGVVIFYVTNEKSVVFWLIFAMIVSVFGTIGDLFESMIKRKSGIKDSGSLIPGHGGILDRIDSLLFAVPFIYLLILVDKYLSI